MACPYFYPTEEVDFEARPRPVRAPLGTIYRGSCHARADEPFEPPEGLLYEQCNFGYGRRSCPWFPSGEPVDAVRFTEWKGGIIFILEKNYAPIEHGPCDASIKSPVLARQAAVATQSKCQIK